MQRYKFLLVEDQPVDAEMAVRALKKSGIEFEHIRVETEKDFRNAIIEYDPDLIISDYSMPQFNGMVALNIAKEICPQLPFIILTGSINEETAVQCMKAGATDYILKDNMTRLPFAILESIKQHEIKKEKLVIESNLKESEERYKSLFYSNHAVMLIIDPDNRQIVDANPAACEFYGWPYNKLTSMSMADINKLSEAELKSTYSQAIKGERNFFLIEHYLSNGTKRNVEVYSGLITTHGKNLLYSIIHDVTDRVKAENENKILAHAIKSINDCVSVTDLENNILFVNESFLRTYGYNEDEIIGKKIELVWSSKNQNGIHSDVLKKTIFGGWQGELWNKCKDGNEFQISLSTSTIKDEKLNVIALVGVSNDITEQKHAELLQNIVYNISHASNTDIDLDQLIELIKQQLNLIIDIKNFYVALYNENDDTFSSPYMLDEKDNVNKWPAGKSLTAFVLKNEKSALLTKDEILDLERKKLVETLGTIPEIWLGVPLKIKGKTFGVFAIQNYQNKSAYNQKHLEMLEFVSYQMSISIERKKTEQELIKAKEKAEESDRLKTAFLANISHEIRTPMNGILGFSDMLARENLDTEKRELFIEIIHKSGNQLLTIIDDIIDISKIETEQIKVEKEIFDLNEVMDYTFELFKPQIDQLNLEFEYIPDCKNKICIVESDKVRVQQIITNLLNNAIKFTHKGFIKYGYSIIENNVRIFVKDSGIGIAPEHMDIVFERFRQVDEGSSRNYGGTGLGLSISKALVEKLEGTIWLESEPGIGSTFYFTIPVNSFNAVINSSVNESNTKKIIQLDIEITILIVDDEEMNYLYLKEIIDFFNIKNIYASNGQKAVELVEKHPEISLILMDIKMPVMNGYISTKKIKRLRPDLPIIAQTAYAQQGDREKAINAGCDDYITKPIKETELISLIKKVLNK